ncbi:MAG: hypothetical protein K6V97_15045 [Actinomycetia bacterium]|nr:hypothetical protein [Actinomycetes bacterium]
MVIPWPTDRRGQRVLMGLTLVVAAIAGLVGLPAPRLVWASSLLGRGAGMSGSMSPASWVLPGLAMGIVEVAARWLRRRYPHAARAIRWQHLTRCLIALAIGLIGLGQAVPPTGCVVVPLAHLGWIIAATAQLRAALDMPPRRRPPRRPLPRPWRWALGAIWGVASGVLLGQTTSPATIVWQGGTTLLIQGPLASQVDAWGLLVLGSATLGLALSLIALGWDGWNRPDVVGGLSGAIGLAVLWAAVVWLGGAPTLFLADLQTLTGLGTVLLLAYVAHQATGAAAAFAPRRGRPGPSAGAGRMPS